MKSRIGCSAGETTFDRAPNVSGPWANVRGSQVKGASHKSRGIVANNMRAKFMSPVDSYVTALL